MGFSGYNEVIFAWLKMSAFVTPNLLEPFSDNDNNAFKSDKNAELTIIINSRRFTLNDIPICLDSLVILLEGEKDTLFKVGLFTVFYIPALVL